MSMEITLSCARVGCDASEVIELDAGHWREVVGAIVGENAPEWGWDFAGVDEVLHCPEHRS